jgi:hypothetical protein
MRPENKKRIPPKLAVWIAARKRYRLSHAHVQMARELGLNPKKLGSLANHDQERWKRPLPEFIQNLYRGRFARSAPEHTLSIEAIAKQQTQKKAEGKKAKARRPTDNGKRGGAQSSERVAPTTILTDSQVRTLSEQVRAVLVDSFPGMDWSKHDSERIVRMMALSAKCKETRTKRGLSIKDVAGQLRIPQYRIKAVEDGSMLELDPSCLRSYVAFLNLKRWVRQWGNTNPELAKRLEIDEF